MNTQKPTYQELEQEVEYLRKQLSDLKANEKQLKASNKELFKDVKKAEERELPIKKKIDELETTEERLRKLNQELFTAKEAAEEKELLIKEHIDELKASADRLKASNEELFRAKEEAEKKELLIKEQVDELKATEEELRTLNEELFKAKAKTEEREKLIRKQLQELKINEDKLKTSNDNLLSTTEALKQKNQELIIAKQVEEANKLELSRINERYDYATTIGKVGTWDWNLAIGELIWNDEAYRIFGYYPKEVTPSFELFLNIIHTDDKEFVSKNIETVRLERKALNIDFRIILPNNEIRYCNAKGKVEYDENDRAIRMIGIFLDITERKKVEKELLEAKNKAEESDKLKSAFLANMSHEIRTPMNAIMGFSSFLAKKDLSIEDSTRYVEIIKNSSQHLLNLINDVIDISKIEAGEITISKSDLDINVLLRELYNFFHSQLVAKKKYSVALKMHIPKPEFHVLTDETRLRQILINLIGNAIKFTDSGEVEFGYAHKGDKIEFYVRDTGIGIPKEKQKLIFKRFQQATDTTKKIYGGTGLGLAIAKACTQLLNGDIWLNSIKNIGTTFYFTIEYTPGKKQIDKPERSDKNFTFNNELILVAEDDDYNYDYFDTILTKHGLIKCISQEK